MRYNSIFVKEYELDKNKLDLLFENTIQDCRDIFYDFNYSSECNLEFTKIRKIKVVISKNKDRVSQNSLKGKIDKMIIARQKKIFNHINKLTIKFTADLADIIISYYLQLKIPHLL